MGALTLLVDADVIVHQSAAAHQRVTDWGDGTVSVATDPIEDAIETMRKVVAEYKRHLHAKFVVWCISHSDNFRKLILPTYKANRPVKPTLVAPLKEWVKANTKCYVRPGLEGDDVIGILATHPKLLPGTKVIVSIDKDLKTIPGTIYNPGKDTLTRVSREEADYWHLFQTLTGDPTDNYKGCPGIGPVKAEKILYEGGGSMWASPWERIVAAFAEKDLTEADALIQARVARILRHTDYDFKRKEPILWRPPTASP